MHRPFLLPPYTRFSRVSPAHYTRKGRFTPPFVIVYRHNHWCVRRADYGCALPRMYFCAVSLAHRDEPRPLSRLCLPHPAGGVQISVCPLCTEGLARHGARSSDTSRGFRASGICPSVLMRTSEHIAGIYRPARFLKGRNNRKERKSERDMDCGITTTILILAPQTSAQYQLTAFLKNLPRLQGTLFCAGRNPSG